MAATPPNTTIRSATFPNCYLRLDGRTVSKFNHSGSGHVDCQSYVGPYETLQLVNHPDGTFAVRSATFENVYLRLEAKDFKKSSGKGGGVVNCQFGASDDEKFKFVDQPDGSKAIASVKWPGVYLRMDGTPKELPGNDNGFGVVNAELSIGPWEKFIVSEVTIPLVRADIDTAIKKFGPILKMHPNEAYLPCSVEWFLSQSTLVDAKTGVKTPHPTVDQLPQDPLSGDKRYSLDVAQSAKPGNLSTAKAYVHAFWEQGMTVTDLQFWFFSAYNGSATAHVVGLAFDKPVHQGDPDLKPLGEHWADWEYVTLRIDNKTKDLIAICLSQHGTGHWTNLSDFPKTFKFSDMHPIIYSSRNGHANYPSPGPNYMEYHKFPSPLAVPAGLEFSLRNDTADGGVTLDCSQNYQVVLADFLKAGEGYPDAPWVKYKYRWGPEGTLIRMRPDEIAEIVKAGFGDFAELIPGDDLLRLVGAIVPYFFSKDINGAAAPIVQGTWLGRY